MRKFGAIVLCSLGVSLGMMGCGGHAGIGNITSTISPSGTLSLDAGQSVSFTAAVQGDSTNSGVTWQAILPGVLTTQSKTAATFQAPATVTSVSTSAVIATPVKNGLYSATTFINLYPVLAVTKPTPTAAKVGVPYSYQLVSSGGASPVTWTVTSGTLPFGLSLSASGLLSGVPTTANTYTFTVSTTDSANTPMSFTNSVTMTVAPATVSITTAALPGALTNQPYSVTLGAQYGITPYTWTVASGTVPPGLTLSTGGVLSGTPSKMGQYTFTISVTDSTIPPVTASMTYTIGVYDPVSITTTTLSQGSIKDPYSQTLSASGGDGPLTWTVASGKLPDGLQLSTAGVIYGTPTAVGTFNFSVKVGDSFSPQQTATASFSIQIVLTTLQITTTSLANGTTGTSYSQQLTSTGGNAPVTWSLASSSGPLPANLTLSAGGLLSGTPSVAGTYPLVVQASDSTPASVTQALTLTVLVPSDLKITTTSVPTANIATPYSTTLSAALGKPNYTWSLSSGTLPNGITLSSAGVLAGTTYAPGTFNFTVKVTDSTGASVTQALTLTVGTTLPTGVANSQLSGPYAFEISGHTSGSAAGKVYGFGVIGSVTADGNGNLVGTEDINTATGVQTGLSVTGKYTVGSDGRGFAVLTAGSASTLYSLATSTPVSGISQSLTLAEFDNTDGTGSVASGYGFRQTAAAFTAATVKGTFAFGIAGESICSTCGTAVRFGPVAAAGIFTADGTSAISAGLEDASEYGKVYNSIPVTGSFTAPSTTTGRGTLTMKYTGTLIGAPPAGFTYVIVNANQMLLMSTDSHATTALLQGEARLQQQTNYSTASFTGTSISYESKADGGDGLTAYPTSLDAMVSAVINTSAGNDTYQTDSNIAGTFVAGTAKPETYAVTTNGRATVNTGATSNHVVYLYDTGSGYGLDLATTGNYPALVKYELQVINGTTQEPLLYGTFVTGNVPSPIAATTDSGLAGFTFYSGSVNGAISGKLTTTLDTSTVAGVLSGAVGATQTYFEDTTGRMLLIDPTTNATTGVAYAISPTKSVAIPAGSGTTPSVQLMQQ